MLRRMMSAQADLHRKWLESVSTRQRCQSFRRAIGTAASHAWNLVAVLSNFDGAVTRCVFLQTVCLEKITKPLSVETRPCFLGNSGLITCLHLHDQQTLVQAFKSATILENEQFLCMCAVLVSNFWFYRCADHVFLCLWNLCVKLLLFSQDFILILSSHVIQFGLFHRIFILILSSHV